MKRILIVEDDMALAQELQYLLISNQYDAQCIEEFTDVAGQILASQADMVFLDINLPDRVCCGSCARHRIFRSLW